MADSNNVEEFTIKYKVDTGSAAKNLHEFGEHVKKVKHEGKEGAGAFGELGESFVGAAAEALSAGAIIGTVMAGIAKAISSTVEAMKDYNEQLELGKKSSIGYAMQTIISNNMIKANPLLTEKDTKATMETLSNFLSKAYTNPNTQNEQNGILTRMGINVFGPNGQPIDKQEAIGKIAEHFKSVSAEEAEAEGRRMGISPDAAASMHITGKAMLDTSDATLAQVERQQEAAAAAEELHKHLNTFWGDVAKIARVLTDELMDPMAKMSGKISEPSHVLAESYEKEGTGGILAHSWEYLKKRKYSWGDLLHPGQLTEENKRAWDDTAPKDTEKKKEDMTGKLDKEHKVMDDFSKPIDTFNRSTNMFAAAVASMPGSLSEQEAFAAWAGGVATAVLDDAKASSRSNGSGGSGSVGSGGSGGKAVVGGKPLSPEVLAYLAETDRLIGAKPGTSAAQAQVESRGDTSAHSGKGAHGLMQVIPSTQAALEKIAGRKFDANNEMDSVIMHRMLMQQNVKRFGNVEDAQRAYNGGWTPKTWGNPETAAYVGSINATRDAGRGSGGGRVVPGRGPEDNRYTIALGSLANVLKLKNVNTLARGEEGSKDAAWALNAAQSGLGLRVKDLQTKLIEDTNTHQFDKTQDDIQNLRKAQAELKATVDYGPEIAGNQKGKESDGRTRYMDEQQKRIMPLGMTVNITGVSDPHEVVRILGEQTEKIIQEQSNRITG